jgi:flavin-dependent thymidylate synthase
MKVTLISHTQDAVELLLFTKSTRLNLTASLLEDIKSWRHEDKMAELEYMANTIPSSWEFVSYVFAIEGVSRAFTHQFVRNRHGSYAQQSMRVTDMCDFDYVYTERNLQPSPDATISPRYRIDKLNAEVKATYKELIEDGQPPEDARGILPTNIATNIIVKFNMRTMAELAKSRTGGRTQNEYQQVMGAMIDAVLAVHPWAEKFFFPKGRDFFAEIEAFAAREFPNDLMKKGELLKIVDQLRKQ